MSTVALQPMKVVGNLYSGSGSNQYVATQFKNKASQVFKSGELVCVDATPEVLRFATIIGGGDDRIDVSALSTLYAGTTPNIIPQLATATRLLRIYGITLKEAPASGQIYIPVAQILPGTIIEGNLVTATSGDGDAPAALALIAGHLMAQVGIVFDDTRDQYYFTPTPNSTTEYCADIIKIALGVGGDTSMGGIGDFQCRVQAILRPGILRHTLDTTNALAS